MAEGPQVRLRTAWLRRYLEGRPVFTSVSTRPELAELAARLRSRTVQRVFCKGKNIFLDFGDDTVLHNHLLMRGRWRRLPGQSFLLPPDTWLALYVGPHTVCNVSGQVLRLLGPGDVERKLAELGPDVMADPYPRSEILAAIASSPLPIAVALMEQSLLCGVGNTAKSEALFLAGVDPAHPSWMIEPGKLENLADRLHEVLQASYHQGGRWETRVYRRRGRPCPRCGDSIRRMVQGMQRRATFFCARCQGG